MCVCVGMPRRRILSIQSHVVRGYLGNRAAVFPLELLGHEVDVINTVNRVALHIPTGETTSADTIEKLLSSYPYAALSPLPGNVVGCEERPGLEKVGYIISGYAGAKHVMQAVARFMQRHEKTKDFLYVCDPVMGDNGEFYIDPEIVNVYNEEVFPYADIITPNADELQWLSGLRLEGDVETVKAACLVLHRRGPKHVICTSITPQDDPSKLVLVGSSFKDGVQSTFTFRFPKLPAYHAGTGDLFAGMLVHGLSQTNDDVKRAALFAAYVVLNVMKATIREDPAATELNPVRHRAIIVEAEKVTFGDRSLLNPLLFGNDF